MNLYTLLEYDKIDIQCHDNPDADAIATGYALYTYFSYYGKDVRLFYSGQLLIKKPNLLTMISNLEIPLEYYQSTVIRDLLVTVDCQYGSGNVTYFPATNVAIIDHHERETKDTSLVEIRPYLASCSTLIWSMLNNEKFDLSHYPNVSTALYYGLYSDTANLSEISHPLDKDMQDNLTYDSKLITRLRHSNLLLKDIETAGIALLRCSYNETNNSAVFQAQPCDPNILGFIADLALQVNTIYTCVVYNETSHGIKFSVRSCIPSIMANEMAVFLADDIGSGGGHREKAGGYILSTKFYNKHPDLNMDSYLLNKIREYHDDFKIIYSDNHHLDINQMTKYKKRKIKSGFISTLDLFDDKAPILIRTLEGDINTFATNNTLILIGSRGQVAPITREEFERVYTVIDESFIIHTEYIPHIKNRTTEETFELKTLNKTCIPFNDSFIFAIQLTKNTKVFTEWNDTGYMTGKAGDYIAIKADNNNDVFTIDKTIFDEMYDKVESK